MAESSPSFPIIREAVASFPDRELVATRILEVAGGRHVHVHGRSLRPEEAGPSIHQ